MRKTNIIRGGNNLHALAVEPAAEEFRHGGRGDVLLMTLVRRPRDLTQASRLPIRALPMPIQVEARPYFHPN